MVKFQCQAALANSLNKLYHIRYRLCICLSICFIQYRIYLCEYKVLCRYHTSRSAFIVVVCLLSDTAELFISIWSTWNISEFGYGYGYGPNSLLALFVCLFVSLFVCLFLSFFLSFFLFSFFLSFSFRSFFLSFFLCFFLSFFLSFFLPFSFFTLEKYAILNS